MLYRIHKEGGVRSLPRGAYNTFENRGENEGSEMNGSKDNQTYLKQTFRLQTFIDIPLSEETLRTTIW